MSAFTISNNAAAATATWPLPQFNTCHFPHSPSIVLHHSLLNIRAFRIHCVPQEPLPPLQQQPKHDQLSPGGDGGHGDAGGGGGGGGDGGEGGGDEEFGPLLKFEAVMRESEARGVKLPPDMVEAARITGIREMFLLRYLELQVGFLESFNFWFQKVIFSSLLELNLASFIVIIIAGFVLATVFSDAALCYAEKSNAS